MKCPECGTETAAYWQDGIYGLGNKYYKCRQCEHHWDTDLLEQKALASLEAVEEVE